MATNTVDGRLVASPLDSYLTLELAHSDNAETTARNRMAAEKTKDIIKAAKENLGDAAKVGRVSRVSIEPEKQQLAEQSEVLKQQAINNIDYNVNSSIDALRRAQEDAKQEFQTQRNQVYADEVRALDNQVLYSEARGDDGGIGKSQYGSIQNTAANNRYNINAQQVKLATDTQRQITDLRAQGEFEKADKILEISQKYLAELMDLEQWADETNVGVDEFNVKVDEWEQEYRKDLSKYLTDVELEAAKATGSFSDGTLTQDRQEYINKQLKSAFEAALANGVAPTVEQLEAAGWTEPQYWNYKASNIWPDVYY